MAMLSVTSLNAQRQAALPVTANFKIEEGSLEGSYLVLENLTTGTSQTLKGTGKFNLNLPYHNEFLLSFNKPGYITKKIQIDTRAPEDRIQQGFYPVNFDVILFKQYEGVNIVVFNQPVARYKFNRLLDEIFYDTDYTKQIQSALKATEEELKQKREEEKKNAEALKKEAAKQKADSLARAKEMEKQRADSLEAARKANLARAEEERKIQRAAEEEQRKQARVAAEEEAKRKAKEKAEDEERKKLTLQEEAEERKRKAARQKEEEEAKRKAILNQQQERREAPKAVTVQGFDQRNLERTHPPLPQVRVEEITEGNRTIIKAIVETTPRDAVYLKIIYKWGGVFYFKENKSISETMFRQATGIR
jgi:hypothetical protein